MLIVLYTYVSVANLRGGGWWVDCPPWKSFFNWFFLCEQKKKKGRQKYIWLHTKIAPFLWRTFRFASHLDRIIFWIKKKLYINIYVVIRVFYLRSRCIQTRAIESRRRLCEIVKGVRCSANGSLAFPSIRAKCALALPTNRNRYALWKSLRTPRHGRSPTYPFFVCDFFIANRFFHVILTCTYNMFKTVIIFRTKTFYLHQHMLYSAINIYVYSNILNGNGVISNFYLKGLHKLK